MDNQIDYKYKYKKYKYKCNMLIGRGGLGGEDWEEVEEELLWYIKLVMFNNKGQKIDLGTVMDVVEEGCVDNVMYKLENNPCFREFNHTSHKKFYEVTGVDYYYRIVVFKKINENQYELDEKSYKKINNIYKISQYICNRDKISDIDNNFNNLVFQNKNIQEQGGHRLVVVNLRFDTTRNSYADYENYLVKNKNKNYYIQYKDFHIFEKIDEYINIINGIEDIINDEKFYMYWYSLNDPGSRINLDEFNYFKQYIEPDKDIILVAITFNSDLIQEKTYQKYDSGVIIDGVNYNTVIIRMIND